MKKTVFVVMLATAVAGGSLFFLQPVQAEGAVRGSVDLALKIGRILAYDISVDMVLVENHGGADTNPVSYDVHGHGSYTTVAGESGRLIVQEGSWDNTDNDPDRHVDVRFVSGPLRGRTFVVNLPLVINGTVSGMWTDEADPQQTGTASGTTDLQS